MSRAWNLGLCAVLALIPTLACGDGGAPTGDQPATASASGGGAAGGGAGAGGTSGGAGASTGAAGATGSAGAGGNGGTGSAGTSGSGESGAGAGAGAGAGMGGGVSQGFVAPPCRIQADCPTGTSCYAQPPVQACRGVACRGQVAGFSCTGDEACAAPQLCNPLPDPLCTGEWYRGCTAPCTDDSTCNGLQCQPDGHCLPVKHCTIGVACPVHFHCDASSFETDALGCVRDTCESDADCGDGDGYCLGQRCYLQLWTCERPPEPCLAP